MYNLRLFMHSKLVIIELVVWWHAVSSIHTTGEAQPNRLYCRDALSHMLRFSSPLFKSVSKERKCLLKLYIFSDSLTVSTSSVKQP